MMSGERNPCDLCGLECSEAECVLYRVYNEAIYCSAHECFVNYEGSCLLSLYDDCGCRKSAEGEG